MAPPKAVQTGRNDVLAQYVQASEKPEVSKIREPVAHPKAVQTGRNDVLAQYVQAEWRNRANRRNSEIEGGLLGVPDESKAWNHSRKPVQESMSWRGSQSSETEAGLMALRENVICEGQKEAKAD